MSDPNDTKEIIVSESALKGGKKRRSRKMKGGGSTQGAIVQLQSTTSSSTSTDVVGTNPSNLASIAAPIIQDNATVSAAQSGGKKVVLKAAKKKTQKVVLSSSKAPNLKLEPKSKTRKAKKITFSLKHLRNKLHKAKTIKKHSQDKSFDEIKKVLEEAKLLKVGSKAPEAMIRQTYNDYMTLKHAVL